VVGDDELFRSSVHILRYRLPHSTLAWVDLQERHRLSQLSMHRHVDPLHTKSTGALPPPNESVKHPCCSLCDIASPTPQLGSRAQNWCEHTHSQHDLTTSTTRGSRGSHGSTKRWPKMQPRLCAGEGGARGHSPLVSSTPHTATVPQLARREPPTLVSVTIFSADRPEKKVGCALARVALQGACAGTARVRCCSCYRKRVGQAIVFLRNGS
jgi:hypothetical protein